MSTSSIVLPSGLAGEIRGLKVHEANLLANAAEQRRGSALDSVYSSVWLATTDAGPYALDAAGKLAWPKVLVCDRFVLMLKVRAKTYGPEYAFKVRCTAPACGERFEWELSLDDLPLKPLPELAVEAFKNGNRLAATFPSTGRAFWYRLQDGDGEKKAEQLMKQNRARQLTAALASRIIEVEGVHANDKLKFLDDLDLDDAAEVLALLDETDGGVESSIDVVCPACGDTQEMQLPFGKEFWMPLRKKAR